MYDLFIGLWGVAIFVVMPILIIRLIIRLIKKKFSIKDFIPIGICFWLSVICLFGGIFTAPEETQTEMPTTTEQVETTAKIQEPTTEKATTEIAITEKIDTMVQQFVQLGFTQGEAEEMKETFATVGITKISNIQFAIGSGIDNLQSFTCDIYDYHRDKGGVSVHFTIDKRQLCFISLDGIPTTKTDYAYINIFGNVKFKTSNTTKSVTLYDKWDENGEIDDSAIGYLAVFDYENKKITKYE